MRYFYIETKKNENGEDVCVSVSNLARKVDMDGYISSTEKECEDALGKVRKGKKWVEQEIPEEEVMEIIAKKEKQILEIKESIAELSNKAVK